jgi:phosphoribosylformylglycinamidine cyclo-ligase
MFRTFNMGIGFILITKRSDAPEIIKMLNSSGENAYIIGHVEKGKRGVIYV